MTEAAPSLPNPQLVRVAAPAGGCRIVLSGPWNLAALAQGLPKLRPDLAKHALDAGCSWDLSAVTALDHAGALLLWRLWGRRRAPQLVLRPEHESLFDDLVKERALPAPPLEWWATTIGLGQKALTVLGHERATSGSSSSIGGGRRSPD